MPKQPVPVKGAYEVVITFVEPLRISESNVYLTDNIGEKRRALCGCMKGKSWVSDDFDAPLDEMKEYME